MTASGDGGRDRWTFVIAGGGTGGHLFPGIAVARELQRQVPGASVSFAGTTRGIEARVVPQEGFDLDVIRSAGLKGKSMVARLRGAALLVPSLLDAWRLLSRRRPRVVVGVGGYSSGPVVLVAALRGIPTLVLEQNAVPGLTNRLLGRVVRAAAVTYDETRVFFGDRAFVAGNPVRPEFVRERPSEPHDGRPRRLLVLGGSQGAHAVNEAVSSAMPEILRRCTDLEVTHQTGARDQPSVAAMYAPLGGRATAVTFLDGVADHMAAADLILCRAGATTLAEIAALGRPAVVVPLPTATDDHQRRNARVLADANAVVMVEERDLTGDRLASLLVDLLNDRDRRVHMGEALRRFARPDAAARIVARVRELAA